MSTHEVIKSIEDGRPTVEGGYTIRLIMQNGDLCDVDITAETFIDHKGRKHYDLGIRESWVVLAEELS